MLPQNGKKNAEDSFGVGCVPRPETPISDKNEADLNAELELVRSRTSQKGSEAAESEDRYVESAKERQIRTCLERLPIEYVRIKELGLGKDGTVFLCMPRSVLAEADLSQSTNAIKVEVLQRVRSHLCAVKVSRESKRATDKVAQELRMLTAISTEPHAGICRLYSADAQVPCLSIAYVCGGSLQQYHEQIVHEKPPSFAWHVASQLVETVAWLHTPNVDRDFAIAHRDIHLGNIMLDPHTRAHEHFPNLVLIDFANAVRSRNKRHLAEDLGSIWWVFHTIAHNLELHPASPGEYRKEITCSCKGVQEEGPFSKQDGAFWKTMNDFVPATDADYSSKNVQAFCELAKHERAKTAGSGHGDMAEALQHFFHRVKISDDDIEAAILHGQRRDRNGGSLCRAKPIDA